MIENVVYGMEYKYKVADNEWRVKETKMNLI